MRRTVIWMDVMVHDVTCPAEVVEGLPSDHDSWRANFLATLK